MLVTYYDPVTGRILGAASCSEEEAIANKPSNAEVLPGLFDGEQFYIQDFLAIKKPEKPNDYYAFNYSTKQWEDIRSIELQWIIVRDERSKKLQECDWTQLVDIPDATKQLWEPYRQSLRDVTLQADPFNIVWPTPPQG
jgi:hypothetical protein